MTCFKKYLFKSYVFRLVYVARSYRVSSLDAEVNQSHQIALSSIS